MIVKTFAALLSPVLAIISSIGTSLTPILSDLGYPLYTGLDARLFPLDVTDR